MAKTKAPTKRMTYQEFLSWCDEDTWAEWVDGEVVMVTPASDRHQDLVRFLIQVLGTYVEAKALGVVRPAPFQMYLPELRRGREPDFMFIASGHLDRLKDRYLEGPADLVVEIVSPESRLRDRGEKYAEYELAGVPEYWLIDPELQRADFYVLDKTCRFRLMDLEPEGVFRSQAIPGFSLKSEWLWQEPLPKVLEVLKELGVI